MECLNAYVTGNLVNWIRRNESGVCVVNQQVAKYESFHKVDPKTISNAKRFVSYSYKDGEYYRVGWKDRFSREAYCKNNPNDSFEGDVSPIRRVLSDAQDIIIQKPRILHYDIETDTRIPFLYARQGQARILSISSCDEYGLTTCAVLKEDSDQAEQEMLAEFMEYTENYDCLSGWFSSIFDDLVLEERVRMLGAYKKDFRRLLKLDQAQAFKRHNINNAEDAGQKQSLALEAIAQSLLGTGKIEVDRSKIYELWKDNPDLLGKYNLRDCTLLPQIEKKKPYLDLVFNVARLCRLFPDNRSMLPTQQIDAFMLRLGSELKHRFPTKYFDDAMQPEKRHFEGALVLEPQRLGIHKNVYVCDFASLYPSIMLSFNMSPEVHHFVSPEPKEGYAVTPNNLAFSQEKRGILCKTLERLIEYRSGFKHKEDNSAVDSPEWVDAIRSSMSVKVVINGLWGAVANEFSRHYDFMMAESIPATGRWLIQNVMDFAKQKGFFVLMGDTDSCFAMEESNSITFEEFVKLCNEELIPGLLKSRGCIENRVKLDYEKRFAWLVCSTDGEGESVCKKYVGQFNVFKGKPVSNPKPKFMGLEVKRGDTTKLARDMQRQIIDMLCQKKFNSMEYEKFVAEWRMKVMQGPLTIDDITLSKSISKNLDDYKTNSPHVRIARLIEEEEGDVSEGTRIFYFVKNGGVSPIEVDEIKNFKGECDRGYYWTHCYPASMRLLAGAFPNNANWRKWLKISKDKILKGQLGLF